MTKRESQVTTLRALKRKWMKDPDFRREYDALEEEFALILAVAKARQRSRLGWREVARRMKDDAEHDRASRKRTRPALDPHTWPLRQGDRASADDQF
jgi:hypothetical protein